MKLVRTLIALCLFAALCLPALAYPESEFFPIPTSGLSGWDDTNGKWRPVQVTDEGKVAMEATLELGSTTISLLGAPPTLNQTTTVSVTSTPQNLASLANRRSLTLFNLGTETVWITMDTDTASATVSSGVPVYSHGYFSDELDEGKVLGAVCSTTADLTFYQTGD